MADPIDKGPARAETGPMRFGDDWTGVFLRGDYAGPMGMKLRQAIEHDGLGLNIVDKAMLFGLAGVLGACEHTSNVPEAQAMPDFATVSALVARCERYEAALRRIAIQDRIDEGPCGDATELVEYTDAETLAAAVVACASTAREALES